MKFYKFCVMLARKVSNHNAITDKDNCTTSGVGKNMKAALGLVMEVRLGEP